MTAADTPLQPFGWNGVQMAVPGHWEIGRIGRNYLLFEDERHPALEIKWGVVRGRFVPEKQLQRLSSAQKGAVKRDIRVCDLPRQWETVTSAFSATCFSWQGRRFAGTGLVLYCPVCRTATLIQFFKKPLAVADPVTQAILASFKDHTAAGHSLWAIYDIRATVPSVFRLEDYRFDAGAFRLQLIADGIRATLLRWGPAAVLLRDRPLEAFAATVLDLPPVQPERLAIRDHSGLQWQWVPRKNPVIRTMNRIRKNLPYQWTGLWHVQAKNRILGLRLAGKHAIDARLKAALCDGYASV